MGGVPSVPTDRSRTLQVIGAGYSRTGTVAMQMALEKLLDGPVMHGGTSILGREDAFAKKWVQAYQAKHSNNTPKLHALLKDLFAGYVGCTDMPPIDFIPDLMTLYPDAKVVLTTRDPEKWLESIKPVAANSSVSWITRAMWPIPGWRWFTALSTEFGTSTKEILGETGPEVNPAPSTKLLLNWNEKVKSMVPEDKLLVMEVKQGWAPLCKFLDLPVPEEEFPRANDSNAADKAYQDIVGRLTEIWVEIGVTVGAVGVAGVAIALFFRRQ